MTYPTNSLRSTLVAAAIAAALSACGTLDTRPPSAVEDARLAVDAARGSPQVVSLAPAELSDAVASYDRAYSVWKSQGDTVEARHLAYLALQRAAIAQQAAALRNAERTVVAMSADRDRARLEARTQEAERATRAAVLAEARADVTRRQALEAQQQAAAAEQQARSVRSEAAATQISAMAAEARASQLEDELRALQATRTDRGMVITLGDVLFDPGQAVLRPAAYRMVDKLAVFMREYPQRTVAIEGFTDSTGTYAGNRDLSERRAEAVRRALVGNGVDGSRISVRGYGDSYPVASNETQSGRQQNRRVEILISDDKGLISPRIASYQPPRQ